MSYNLLGYNLISPVGYGSYGMGMNMMANSLYMMNFCNQLKNYCTGSAVGEAKAPRAQRQVRERQVCLPPISRQPFRKHSARLFRRLWEPRTAMRQRRPPPVLHILPQKQRQTALLPLRARIKP